jgi:hypothetical protein
VDGSIREVRTTLNTSFGMGAELLRGAVGTPRPTWVRDARVASELVVCELLMIKRDSALGKLFRRWKPCS